jgi:hypothetical protein
MKVISPTRTFALTAALFWLAASSLPAREVPPPVKLDGAGTLQYVSDADGNRVPDFSHAGYGGGGVVWPRVAARVRVEPVEGEDGRRIQAAIDHVSALPADAQGLARGGGTSARRLPDRRSTQDSAERSRPARGRGRRAGDSAGGDRDGPPGLDRGGGCRPPPVPGGTLRPRLALRAGGSSADTPGGRPGVAGGHAGDRAPAGYGGVDRIGRHGRCARTATLSVEAGIRGREMGPAGGVGQRRRGRAGCAADGGPGGALRRRQRGGLSPGGIFVPGGSGAPALRFRLRPVAPGR